MQSESILTQGSISNKIIFIKSGVFELKAKMNLFELNEVIFYLQTMNQLDLKISGDLYDEFLLQQHKLITQHKISNENKKNNNINLRQVEFTVKRITTGEMIGCYIYTKNGKNIFTLNEIAYIFGKGIPDNLRGDIWMMLLENPTNISEALYNHYLNKINKIDFANVNTSTTTTEGLVNDVIQVKNHFINDITSNALCPNTIMNNAYNIVSVYLLYRPDINYNKCLVYFAFMFLLNKTSEYNSFMNLVSLSTNTALMPFLVNDITIITEKIEFFVKLLKDKESVIYERLKSMAIATDFYFVEWFEFLFVKCFSYKVVKRIWDLFLFKGECVLYRVGLGIVNVKKEILENGMIKGIVDNLQRIGNGYEEECVMEFVEKFGDVDDRYAMWRLNRKFKEEKEFLNMKG